MEGEWNNASARAAIEEMRRELGLSSYGWRVSTASVEPIAALFGLDLSATARRLFDVEIQFAHHWSHVIDAPNKHQLWRRKLPATKKANEIRGAASTLESFNINADDALKAADKIEKKIPEVPGLIEAYWLPDHPWRAHLAKDRVRVLTFVEDWISNAWSDLTGRDAVYVRVAVDLCREDGEMTTWFADVSGLFFLDVAKLLRPEISERMVCTALGLPYQTQTRGWNLNRVVKKRLRKAIEPIDPG